MGEPGAKFIAGGMAEQKSFTFWGPPMYFTMMVRLIIADKLNIVSICRKTMLIEAVLKLEDTSPFLVIPSEGASMLATGGRAGFPMAVHNDGVCHRYIFNRWVENDLLGDAPHADVVVTVFLEALKPVLSRSIRSQRHECRAQTIDRHRNGD